MMNAQPDVPYERQIKSEPPLSPVRTDAAHSPSPRPNGIAQSREPYGCDYRTGVDTVRRLDALSRALSSQNRETSDVIAQCAADVVGARHCSIYVLLEEPSASSKLEIWSRTEGCPTAANRTPSFAEGGKDGNASLQQEVISGTPDAKNQMILCTFDRIENDVQLGLSFCFETLARETIDCLQAPIRIVATMLKKHIQFERTQILLRSRMAQMALLRMSPQSLHAGKDWHSCPANMAKMLAKSFYNDLRDAGLKPASIIEVASSIIAQISSDIARHKRRLEKEPRD